MALNTVPDSTPLASHSPYRQHSLVDKEEEEEEAAHIRLELGKLQAAAVHVDNLLALALVLLRFDGKGAGDDGGGVGFLDDSVRTTLFSKGDKSGKKAGRV